jgi:hypothetical protein
VNGQKFKIGQLLARGVRRGAPSSPEIGEKSTINFD